MKKENNKVYQNGNNPQQGSRKLLVALVGLLSIVLIGYTTVSIFGDSTINTQTYAWDNVEYQSIDDARGAAIDTIDEQHSWTFDGTEYSTIEQLNNAIWLELATNKTFVACDTSNLINDGDNIDVCDQVTGNIIFQGYNDIAYDNEGDAFDSLWDEEIIAYDNQYVYDEGEYPTFDIARAVKYSEIEVIKNQTNFDGEGWTDDSIDDIQGIETAKITNTPGVPVVLNTGDDYQLILTDDYVDVVEWYGAVLANGKDALEITQPDAGDKTTAYIIGDRTVGGHVEKSNWDETKDDFDYLTQEGEWLQYNPIKVDAVPEFWTYNNVDYISVENAISGVESFVYAHTEIRTEYSSDAGLTFYITKNQAIINMNTSDIATEYKGKVGSLIGTGFFETEVLADIDIENVFARETVIPSKITSTTITSGGSDYGDTVALDANIYIEYLDKLYTGVNPALVDINTGQVVESVTYLFMDVEYETYESAVNYINNHNELFE